MKPKLTNDLFTKAHRAWRGRNTKLALRTFEMAALQGDASSQNSLAYFYDHGIGTSKNTSKAIYWYRRAALRGNVSAMANLAISYRDQDRRTSALRWFERALSHGDGDSAVELAKLYLQSTRTNLRQIRNAKRALQFAIKTKSTTPSGRAQAKRMLAAIAS